MLVLPDQHFSPIYHDMINAKQYDATRSAKEPLANTTTIPETLA
jgi:hypothetical protein